ncbi:MAG: DNA double-strand break repair nuclease NurA [Rhodothermales bacterium]
MLDFQQLQQQFDGFSDYQQRERALVNTKLDLAEAAWATCAADWEHYRDSLPNLKLSALIPTMLGQPDETFAATPRPDIVTVVATDGSQIYPDRHREPSCYLLNISRIAFHYGTHEAPLIESVPQFRYRTSELQDHFDELVERASTDVVSALRDGLELEHLQQVADVARTPGRPLVAMGDGTLIRWMLRSLNSRELEDQLIAQYVAVLEAFERQRIPVCSFISLPGNTEVINLLKAVRNEHKYEHLAPDETLEGVLDRWLIERTLPLGHRSAVFESASHVQSAYSETNRICYVYIHVPIGERQSEIARVEMPRWVADDVEHLDLVHAVVLSECEKGRGYPLILSEAHERAVIRSKEKEAFYEMVRYRMEGAGLPLPESRKAQSKRRPFV